MLEEAILAGRGAATGVVVTQPRRIAATSVAERVAAERGERGGPGSPGERADRPPLAAAGRWPPVCCACRLLLFCFGLGLIKAKSNPRRPHRKH